MGWLARQHGLTCDNVVSFEMVTADGEVVRAAEDQNPELYWGLRGGGGNFGIVTEFQFRLHRVGTRALSVELDFPVAGAAGVLARWRDLNATAPRQATFAATVLDGIVTVGFVWVGDPEAGRRHARELHSLGRPASERIAELSYVELQRREDSVEGHALRRYWKGHYFRELPGAALDALLDHHPGVAASLQAYGGAIAEVPDDATAFSQRDAAFEYVAAARWTDPAEDADRMAQARRSAARLAPFASGAYVNALTDEGAAGVTRAYPPAKLARLTALKDAWDPRPGHARSGQPARHPLGAGRRLAGQRARAGRRRRARRRQPHHHRAPGRRHRPLQTLSWPRQPWWRPPNCQSWISTLAYSPACTYGAPASMASTAARSRSCTSSALPTHPAPSSDSKGPRRMNPWRWPGSPNQRRCAPSTAWRAASTPGLPRPMTRKRRSSPGSAG